MKIFLLRSKAVNKTNIAVNNACIAFPALIFPERYLLRMRLQRNCSNTTWHKELQWTKMKTFVLTFLASTSQRCILCSFKCCLLKNQRGFWTNHIIYRTGILNIGIYKVKGNQRKQKFCLFWLPQRLWSSLQQSSE